LMQARRDFLAAVLRWKAAYNAETLVYYVSASQISVFDRRRGEEQRHRFEGIAAEVFLYLDGGHSFPAIQRRFPLIAPQALRSFLARLVSLRYVYHDRVKDAYLSVTVRVYDAEQYRKE